MNIFIDTEDMEERYCEQLYYDFLIEQNIDLQQRIDKAIEFINKKVDPEPWSFYKGKAFYDLLEILKGTSE